jgi:hypothetical protein
MENDFYTAHCLFHARRVPQIRFDHLKASSAKLLNQVLQIFALSGAEVIQHADRVALRKQLMDNMRTNEPGATCDQIFHLISLSA